MINPNTAFEEELYFQYLRDPNSVSPEWRHYFSQIKDKSVFVYGNTGSEAVQSDSISTQSRTNFNLKTEDGDGVDLKSGDDFLEALNSIQSKIALNMEESIEIPTATSVRTIPVKALDENRRIINKYLIKMKRPRVSFTHILLWAIVKALIKFPQMNDSFTRIDGKQFRLKRNSINIGLAVDVVKKDGSRLLLVPNIKNAQNYNFSEFILAFDNLIEKTRANKLELQDLMGTTVTLTNPGMIGTTFSSPRLMKGQGLILATGAIDYPTEFQAVRPEVLTTFAVSKVVTMTNTYDHRIIQGAESAEFLAYISKLLLGEEHFYDQIFASLKIPFEPVRWAMDTPSDKRYGVFDQRDSIEKGAHVMLMINAYRVRGHLLASVNPLGFESYYYPELDPAYYGFTIWDLDRTFHADDAWESNEMTLRDIIELLRETYCGSIGIEFMHIQSPDKKEWIKKRLEKQNAQNEFSNYEKIRIYKKLAEAEQLENFLHTKFIGHKRFSLEGSETAIVCLDKLFELAADSDLHSIVLGMAHRGRLNVLVNILGKDPSYIFNEFDDDVDRKEYMGSGDVKYHLGDRATYISENNGKIEVFLAPNPSHLELVDPVIEGMARAIDNEIKDKTHSKALPVIVHGDAAFAGQGIVAETLNMSQLTGYKTGGTIHIIINNQIGFTTSISDARSTVYATDIAKMIQTPILHVNGNDPEAVVTAAKFAFDYRNKFKSDIIIDILGFRKYGHNEADEPTYTQPLLYKKIKSMIPIREIYEEELIKEKELNKSDAEKFISEIKTSLANSFAKRKQKIKKSDSTIKYKPGQIFEPVNTRVSKSVLQKITASITSVPDGFQANPKVLALLKKRREMFDSQKPAIDWAFAEALAFGSILLEGKEIRFSGEDSRRGTFSQRHTVLTDMINEDEYIPLNNIAEGQAKLRIFDSPLSEVGVLGFEYGFSVIATNSLTLWEAQFGDFANVGQPIIDQFIICAEAKWNQPSNLVMLLPHGYDGQGPEHSSARLERFLQLCAEENIIVGNFTSPAQYFHALRRQVHITFKKPMVLMTPKSMLRHPLVVCSIDDLTDSGFIEIIDDNIVTDKKNTKKILLCSGKIFFELKSALIQSVRKDIALIRIEQLYPFNSKLFEEILSSYENATEVIWVQEEPRNMGAFNFIFANTIDLLPNNLKLKYIGRKDSASTATGSFKLHNEEQNDIINAAILGN